MLHVWRRRPKHTLEILLLAFDAKPPAVITLTLVLRGEVWEIPRPPFTCDAMNSMKGPFRNRPPDFSAAYMHEIDP